MAAATTLGTSIKLAVDASTVKALTARFGIKTKDASKIPVPAVRSIAKRICWFLNKESFMMGSSARFSDLMNKIKKTRATTKSIIKDTECTPLRISSGVVRYIAEAKKPMNRLRKMAPFMSMGEVAFAGLPERTFILLQMMNRTIGRLIRNR